VFAKVVKRDKSATKTLKKSNREQHTGRVWKRTGIRQGNVYRVWIPARLSENGKRCRWFFATKAEAEKFILQTKRQGSVQLAELGVEEKHVLGVIRQSEKYEPTLLFEAWRRFEKEGTGENGNLTVQELAEKFVARQKAEGRSARTVIDDRWRLQTPSNSRAIPKLRQIDLAWPIWRKPFGSGGNRVWLNEYLPALKSSATMSRIKSEGAVCSPVCVLMERWAT
jgi:hypothetical protein